MKSDLKPAEVTENLQADRKESDSRLSESEKNYRSLKNLRIHRTFRDRIMADAVVTIA